MPLSVVIVLKLITQKPREMALGNGFFKRMVPNRLI